MSYSIESFGKLLISGEYLILKGAKGLSIPVNFSQTLNKSPSANDLRMDIHNQQPQIDYFHKIIAYHYKRKLQLDDYLLENFSKSVIFVENKYKGKK